MAHQSQREKDNLEKVTDYVEERQLDADKMAAVSARPHRMSVLQL